MMIDNKKVCVRVRRTNLYVCYLMFKNRMDRLLLRLHRRTLLAEERRQRRPVQSVERRQKQTDQLRQLQH